MAHASDIFPACVQDKLFKTERGDVCLYLHEAWPSLLADLGLLGRAMIISRSEQLALVSSYRKLNFVPIPDSTEMLDLSSGLSLDISRLDAVIAGQEANTGNLSFHFFTAAGRGFFKVLLAAGSDLGGFSRLTKHYARFPSAPGPQLSCSASIESAVLADERFHLQRAWDFFNPALGGDFLPGGHNVSWWDALRLAGRERALFLTKVGLMKAILAAHHEQLPLRISNWNEGLHHETTIVPRRLERCGQCFHLFDGESEAHFFFDSDSDIWVGLHGKTRLPAIHVFSANGQRRGLIQFAGEEGEVSSWCKALSADTIASQDD